MSLTWKHQAHLDSLRPMGSLRLVGKILNCLSCGRTYNTQDLDEDLTEGCACPSSDCPIYSLEADPETALDDQDPDMGDCGSDFDDDSPEVDPSSNLHVENSQKIKCMTKTIMLTVTLQTEIEVPEDYEPSADIEDHPFDRRSESQQDYNTWEVVNQEWEMVNQ